MRSVCKEIEGLYFLDVTSEYVVVNNAYKGLIVMDHELDICADIPLDDDVVIDLSLKCGNELLLFSYENECAYYVDLKLHRSHKLDLCDYPDVYFSNIYFWEEHKVYLFADSGKRCFVFDTEKLYFTELFGDDRIMQEKYLEFSGHDIRSYDHDRRSALVICDQNYYIFEGAERSMTDIGIAAEKQDASEIPSDMIYCTSDLSDDTVIEISERNIMIAKKGQQRSFVYPPYESYRFFGGKLAVCGDKKIIYAKCSDASSNGPDLLMRCDDI